jgi:uncharacterized membrane protein
MATVLHPGKRIANTVKKIKKMLKQIKRLSLLAVILFFVTTKSQAQFSVRNTTGETIYVAVTFFEEGHWHTQGWTTLGNGEAEEVYSSPLKNRYIYYYAFSKT